MENKEEQVLHPVWDNIGCPIDRKDTIDDILVKTGMDFEVNLGRMYTTFVPKGCSYHKHDGIYDINDENGNYIRSIDRISEEITSLYSTFRVDTSKLLGIVGTKYEVVQNREILEFFIDIINNIGINEKDITIKRGGILYDGKQVFLVAQLPSYTIGDDNIEKYILFRSSHDGSVPISICFTDVRVWCANMINTVFANSHNKISVKHTRNARNTLAIAENIIHESTEYSKIVKETLEEFQNVGVDEDDVLYLTAQLIWNDKQIEYLKQNNYQLKGVNSDIISTRSYNKFQDILNCIYNGIGQDSKYVQTMYWWYNGVTSYTTHVMEYKSNDDKFCSLTDGSSNRLAQKAYSIAVREI